MLTTTDLAQLANFQPNKNRRYTQLQPGKLSSYYLEVRLDKVQLLRESLNAGARIEAAPVSDFIPFAFVLPQSGEYQFCGYGARTNGFIQAGGGIWDICFKQQLDYVATVFNRDYFCDGYKTLVGCDVPGQFLQSRLSQTRFECLRVYADSIIFLLRLLSHIPHALYSEAISRLLCAEILKLTINTLSPYLEQQSELSQQPKRNKGVKKALEYIHSHAADLPDIKTLCQVANLSERSLQYGFREYIGMTPVQYLRTVRLNGARQQLLNAARTSNKVSDIALDWGFLELGRFARDYKQLFQELPSETLAQ